MLKSRDFRLTKRPARPHRIGSLGRAILTISLLGAFLSPGGAASMAQSSDRNGQPSSRSLKSTERTPIWPDQWPWSSIGRINIAISTKRSICTGSLVGSRTVITAAHCLFDDRLKQWIKPNAVHFLAGLSPGVKYAGHSIVLSYTISPNFKMASEGRSPDYRYAGLIARPRAIRSMIKNDWAVLTLEHALNLKPIPIQPIRNAELPGSAVEKQIVLAGYGEDRPELLAISSGCAAKTDGQELGQGSLEFTCDIDFGGSGSPVLLLENGKAAIIGIANSARSQDHSQAAHGGAGASATQFEQAIIFAGQ